MSNLLADLAACDVETVKAKGLKGFLELAWSKVYPSSPFQDNWHIGAMCEHYEAGFHGQIRELVVNLPPGGSKSSVTSVFFPAWGWIDQPGSSWLNAAYGQKVVRRDAELWKNLIKTSWYQRRWGHLFQIPTVPAIDLIKNDKGGFRLSTTPGGEVTAFHANVQVYDDPNKPEELTPVGLASTKEWAARTMGTRWRRPPEVNFLVCIMQRLHCDDLSQTFLDRGAMHLMIPAEYDPQRAYSTPHGHDPRTVAGELMDPVRLPKEFITRTRRDLGSLNAAAQLDQNPVPAGGAVFKSDTLRFWSTLPNSVIFGVQLEGGVKAFCVAAPKGFDQEIHSWDMAFKDETTSDYVCGQAWGRLGAGFYLLDQEHGHFNFPESCKAVARLARKFPRATTKLVEDKANGTAIVAVLANALPGMLAVPPEGGKFSRASSCTGLFAAGNVYLPDPRMPGFEWVGNLLLPELLSFPRAKKDDQVDALTQALIYLVQNTSYLAEAMAVIRTMMGATYI